MENVDVIQVGLWGEAVGYLSRRDGTTSFEFEPSFKERGLEFAPIEMPLATTGIYKSRETSNTFLGLPGVIADCLPDRYGMSAIEGFFKTQYGLEPPRVNVLQRLLYLGDRSMGALEFRPIMDLPAVQSDFLKIQEIIDAAKKTLAGDASTVAADILRVSASPGGRQAKALVDFDPKSRELRSGFAEAAQGFLPCILKLDGTREGEETNVYGRLEHVYALMARASGIDMPQSFLLEGQTPDGPVAHFVVERFDRSSEKDKPFHYASFCGLLLRDFREKHSGTYEEYFQLVKQLVGDKAQVEEAYRRAVFNIVFRNQDDHTKNFGFVMDRKGEWRLSPAFDLTYVYGFGMSETHQMTLGGKDDEFTRDDLLLAARSAGIRKAKATEVLERVQAAANGFLAEAACQGLEKAFSAGVYRRFRRF